ncbi:phthiocerol/phthiodiolone dimycocerosyl transferase family protein [Mycobacterium sp.]|uniref:phthiocerol/phthiodiolone dimycocerosyl transferase family protein n=1 Tax=Mycobacterium sp. TaxID=1785 RepID=UPI003C72D16D
MFPGSVIRKLARSEEVFAHNETFFALGVDLIGPVDIGAMSDAFDALLQSHPIFAGRLERAADGRHQIVADDLLHPGIWLVGGATTPASGASAGSTASAAMQLDQNQSLLNLRLKLDSDRSELTLYVHHALADAHHVFSLLEELFTRYTDAVVNGDVGPVTPSPAPESLEQVLEKRGMGKKARSGLERFMPLIFAYDLPTSVPPPLPANPDVPQEIPTARIRLTEQETADLVEFGLANQLSLNSLVAAAILLTEWERRNTPHIPIPYLYPVDLRYLVSPPVSDTGSTNPMGVATFVAEITPETDILELARNIVASFRADLSDGVIQQSVLHFSLQYQGSPPGLPPMVLCTYAGPIPAVQTPPGLEIDDFRSEMHCPARTPVDMYSCGTFADRLFIEHHAHAPAARESSLEAIRQLLCSIAAEDSWAME